VRLRGPLDPAAVPRPHVRLRETAPVFEAKVPRPRAGLVLERTYVNVYVTKPPESVIVSCVFRTKPVSPGID